MTSSYPGMANDSSAQQAYQYPQYGQKATPYQQQQPYPGAGDMSNRTQYPQQQQPQTVAQQYPVYGTSYAQAPPQQQQQQQYALRQHAQYQQNGTAVPPAQHQQPHHQYEMPMHHHNGQPIPPASEIGKGRAGFSMQELKNLSPKTKKRLYWLAALAVVALILIILFEVYKEDFERWVTPLRDWLKAREAWSWVIPVAILVILSFPPLFGHEIILLIAGLAYPIGVAIGIACAGAILGEGLVFIVFKYALSGRVRRKCEEKVSWAATARVTQEAGFKGVMIIRYSIVPPHLANPIFATTGMTFWLYMVSVILSLPKQIIFVVLGDPSSKGKTGAKIGKVIAVGVLVIITLYGTQWIRKRLAIAKREIEAERNADIAAKQQKQGQSQAPVPEGVNGNTGMGANANGYGNGNGAVNGYAQGQPGHMSESEAREWAQQQEMDAENQRQRR